jgi:geranylgeranyl reductase family protein
MEKTKSDVIVVGAGPAGSGLALQLARKGLKVLLLDREIFPREKTCGDGLTPRAVAVLQRLNLLDSMISDLNPHRVSGALLFSPSGHRWKMEFGEHRFDLPDFGLIAPRLKLDQFLVSSAVEAGAEFLQGHHVVGFVRSDGRIAGVRAVHGNTEESFLAPVVAIATGASIALHRQLGLLDRMPPVVLSARGYFTGVQGLDRFMEFYFESELMPGYAWIFPVDDSTANVGVGTFPARGAHKKNPYQLLQWFLHEGQAAGRLSGAHLQGKVKGYPLRTDYPSHRASGDGFLLLGESIGLVNPVTGEGIDLALESSELATAAIFKAFQKGDFSKRALGGYDKKLKERFGSYFSGMRVLRDRAVTPDAMDRIIRTAASDPAFAETAAGINLGVLPPQVVLKRSGLMVRVLRYAIKKMLKKVVW